MKPAYGAAVWVSFLLKWLGAAFQIAGVSVVFWDLAEIRRVLQPTSPAFPVRWARVVRSRTRRVLVALKLVEPRTIELGGNLVVSFAGVAVGRVVVRRPEDGRSIEERLQIHRDRLNDLDQVVERIERDLKDETRARSTQIQQALAEIKPELERFRADLEQIAHAGRLRVRWWAGLLLVIGIVLTTAA
jgi:hypothetical protein